MNRWSHVLQDWLIDFFPLSEGSLNSLPCSGFGGMDVKESSPFGTHWLKASL